MITGVVTAFGEAIVTLTVWGESGAERNIEAVIDTGFNGYLTLPAVMIDDLGLPWRRRGRAILADGEETIFDTYELTILWDGVPRRIAVDAVESDPLLGMALLHGYKMTMEIVEGGNVAIGAI